MKVYVASSWRSDRQAEVVRQLKRAGHEVYDFRHPGGDHPDGFHWSEIDPDWESWTPEEFAAGLRHPIARDGLRRDTAGLHWCEAVVLVVPDTPRRSSHIELGYAAGAGKRSVILLSAGEPELMYGLADAVCVTIAEVLLVLEESTS